MIEKNYPTIATADQLLALPNDGNRYELVAGVLKVTSPAGGEHGEIALRIASRLARHVESFDLGRTYAAETGFRIGSDPDTVRGPDAAFVSHDRLQSVEPTSGDLPPLRIWLSKWYRPAIHFPMWSPKPNSGCRLVRAWC